MTGVHKGGDGDRHTEDKTLCEREGDYSNECTSEGKKIKEMPANRQKLEESCR